MLSRKKVIDLIENSDFVSTLSGITFTKYGRDLQNIKKFGKTYKQMFGDEWYDLETQFDVVTKKRYLCYYSTKTFTETCCNCSS